MSTSTSKPETDIILNRANVALARSQRLVASWLPPQSVEESSTIPKTEEELRREEEEIFTAVPETLGVGAPLPEKLPDGSWNRTELDSNEQLRRQLLGRNYQKVMKEKEKKAQEVKEQQQARAQAAATSDHPPSSAVNPPEGEEKDDYDEEDGRTAAVGRKLQSQSQAQSLSMGKKKKKNKKKRKVDTDGDPHSETTAAVTAPPSPTADPEPTGDNQDEHEEDEESSTKQGGQTSSRPTPKGRKKATSFLDEILAERSKKRKKR